MENTVRITQGKVVAIRYVLTDSDGDVIDGCDEENPFLYLHGADNIVAGLEKALADKEVGTAMKVAVPPEEGYGMPQGPGPQPYDRSFFPEEDGEIVPGMQFFADAGDGTPIPLWVTAVEEDKIFMDINHPLAGATLNFDLVVLSIRDATELELEHGHPHGTTGEEVEEDDCEDDCDEDCDCEDEGSEGSEDEAGADDSAPKA